MVDAAADPPHAIFSLYTFRAKDTSSSYQTMTLLDMHTSISSVLWIILDNLFVAFNPYITAKAVLFRFFFFKRRHFTTTTTTTNHLLLQPLQMNGKRSRQRSIINIPSLTSARLGITIFDPLLRSPWFGTLDLWVQRSNHIESACSLGYSPRQSKEN